MLETAKILNLLFAIELDCFIFKINSSEFGKFPGQTFFPHVIIPVSSITFSVDLAENENRKTGRGFW